MDNFKIPIGWREAPDNIKLIGTCHLKGMTEYQVREKVALFLGWEVKDGRWHDSLGRLCDEIPPANHATAAKILDKLLLCGWRVEIGWMSPINMIGLWHSGMLKTYDSDFNPRESSAPALILHAVTGNMYSTMATLAVHVLKGALNGCLGKFKWIYNGQNETLRKDILNYLES